MMYDMIGDLWWRYNSCDTLPWWRCPTKATFLMRLGLSMMSARNLHNT